jgi:hypothetical protein
MVFISLSTIPGKYQLISGNHTLGNDILPVAMLNNNEKEVYFEQTNSDHTAVKFYQGPCSEIQQPFHRSTRMLQLDITQDSRHRIDEAYLGTEESHMGYYSLTISPASVLSTNTCVAGVLFFQDQLDYYKFVTLGHKNKRSHPKCVSSAHISSFTIRGRGYNFAGLESFNSATLNITIIIDAPRYNVTNMSTTTCEFPQPECTVTLNHTNDQGTCILASLQDTNNIITLHYSAWSYSGKDYVIAANTVGGISVSLLFVPVLLWILIICVKPRVNTS